MNLQQLKQRALANPEVCIEYEKLKTEFELFNALLTMRRQAGLSQEELALRLGTQKGNISRLERASSNPSWQTLQRYAHACGFELTLQSRPV